jgi:hypothetical protein
VLLLLHVRPMPSQKQYGRCAHRSSRSGRRQQAAYHRSDQQRVLLSLRASACAEPKTVPPLRIAAGQGAGSKPRTAKATSSSCCSRCGSGLRRESDEQLVLLTSRASACTEPKTVRPLHTAAGQGTVSTPRTTKVPAACVAHVSDLGLCRAKPVRPLRTAAGQGTDSNQAAHRESD